MKKLTLLLATGLAVLSWGSAHAAAFSGMSFIVWNGTAADGIGNSASIADFPLAPPIAQFSYSGSIDFVNNDTTPGASDTFADFFGANTSGIANFTSPGGTLTQAQFLALPMSTSSTSASPINSFFDITGFYTAASNELFTLYHADGASFYAPLNSPPVVFESPSPTATIVASSGTLPAGTDEPFSLVYVDTNGAPAVLSTSNPSAVPEPGSFALLGIGITLLGLTGLALRSRSVSFQ